MQAGTVREFQFMPYGAPELKAVGRRYLTTATVAGSGLWGLIFLAVMLAVAWFGPPVIEYSVPIPIPHEVVAPLSLREQVKIPPVARVSPAVRPKGGVPIPVPDAPPEQPITTTTPQAEGTGQAEGPKETPIVIAKNEGALPGRSDPPPYFEQAPDPVTRVQPEYPPLAQQIGVEGTVLVRALVGKDGRVVDAYVIPSKSVPLLNEAALVAVRKWVFTPALASNRPVAVWVAIPIHFSLH